MSSPKWWVLIRCPMCSALTGDRCEDMRTKKAGRYVIYLDRPHKTRTRLEGLS